MDVSVFTPSHDPTWLPDVYACLKAQTHQDWEWVVVPNGPRAAEVTVRLAVLTKGDRRVRIVPYPPDGPPGVGALKRFACLETTGDLLVEYDHDDLITEDCLATVVREAEAAGPLAFVYSEDVTLRPDGTGREYATEYGWRHRAWEYRGTTYSANRRFPINPRTLSEILYAPDHVRCWTREAYLKAGGHDERLAVGDDHDLMVRTYLAGVPFVGIDRPLYIHRLIPAGGNTFVKNVDQIQAESRQRRDRMLHPLVHEWCRRENLPMFDLGGAHSCPAGYLPVDKHLPQGVPGFRGDVFDWVNGLKPHSVGCVRAKDFLEHLYPDQVVVLLNRIHRALVPGGWLLTMTPAVDDGQGRVGRGAYQDPTHRSFWSPNNWFYWTRKEQAKYVPEITAKFQMVSQWLGYPSEYHKTHQIPYLRADLAALKDGMHWPGPTGF